MPTSGRSGSPTRLIAAQAAASGIAEAAGNDIAQSFAIVDRPNGQLVASKGGDDLLNAESIGKLFTAAFYLARAGGAPDPELIADLRAMIEVSDNDVQSALWREDIIPTVAERLRTHRHQ